MVMLTTPDLPHRLSIFAGLSQAQRPQGCETVVTPCDERGDLMMKGSVQRLRHVGDAAWQEGRAR